MMATTNTGLLAAASLKRQLRFKSGKRTIAFDLPSLGEWQFLRPVLLLYAERHPEDRILIVHHGDTVAEFKNLAPQLDERALHVRNETLRCVRYDEIDIFLTTEQYRKGLEGVYSVALFHGQPSKGLTFTVPIINSFDALFLYGPLHKDAFVEFVNESLPTPPAHLSIFEIGYPKSDDLLNGRFVAKEIRAQLSLDASKKTILYAPAFNEGASLREYGVELIELLGQQSQYNVLVKLPIDCWQPTSDFYATGGVNWFEKIQELEARYPNLRLFSEYQIDPLLACADVLITCISSVSFEFLTLNRPVIFIETPKYYSGFLKQRFPDKDTVSWASRTTVNGGKEFGLAVSDIREIPTAIEAVLAHPDEFPRQQERLKHYLLYNRGHAAEAAVAKIEDLLSAKVKTRRRTTLRGLMQSALDKLMRHPLFLVRQGITKRCKAILMTVLNSRGYTLEKTGKGYIDATQTIQAAQMSGLSVCDYLEAKETDSRKHGRRDRIIAAMKQRHVFTGCANIVEIGAGTGMYLEKVLAVAAPKRYEVYETDLAWVNHLKKTYGNQEHTTVQCQTADGESLKSTPTGSSQLVHAHAVFVYIQPLTALAYLREAARVLAPAGHLVFDCLLDTSFGVAEADAWLRGPWRFPVLLPETLLTAFLKHEGLAVVDRFKEIYGNSFVDYLVIKKVGTPVDQRSAA